MNNLEIISKPIIGLSPMDSITDEPFRLMTNTYGKPDVTYTEFVNVIGITRGSDTLYQSLVFSDLERPIIAQLFGAEPDFFYHAAKITCELGFDGVDINMGCPAKSVASRGAGAALIENPELARQIVLETKRGVEDWYTDGRLTGMKEKHEKKIIDLVKLRMKIDNYYEVKFSRYPRGEERSIIPVSVKTRIGYKENSIKRWIPFLSDLSPSWIGLHGRTLKQMYSGKSDWDAVANAVEMSEVPILANGDVKTHKDIESILQHTKASGVLIGRGTYGNPWFFKSLNTLKDKLNSNSSIHHTQYIPSVSESLKALLEHAKIHEEIKGSTAFVQMRKHMGWYVSSFPGASNLRGELMKTNSFEEVEEIIHKAKLI